MKTFPIEDNDDVWRPVWQAFSQTFEEYAKAVCPDLLVARRPILARGLVLHMVVDSDQFTARVQLRARDGNGGYTVVGETPWLPSAELQVFMCVQWPELFKLRGSAPCQK